MPKILHVSFLATLCLSSCSETIANESSQSTPVLSNQSNVDKDSIADECHLPNWLYEQYPNFQGQVQLYHHPQEGDLFLLDFIYVDGPQIWLKKNGQVWRNVPWKWGPLSRGLSGDTKTTESEPVFQRSCGSLLHRK